MKTPIRWNSLLLAVLVSTFGLSAIAAPRPQTPTTQLAEYKRYSVYRSFEEMVQAVNPVLAPVRAVTRGPKFHWFGYHDKFQLDPSGRYLLCMEVDFEHRLPGAEDAVTIGLVDLADGDRWIELGRSLAWSWQQGCMLQWRPGSDQEVLWNDREGNHFVCRVLNISNRTVRTLPMAIDHVSPDGMQAASACFSRIWNIRAGYGYPGIPDLYANQPAPAEIGVWWMDLITGKTRMLVSLAELAHNPKPGETHYVNHLAWSPDGKRISMFHRWVAPGVRATQVFTIGAEGRDLRLICSRGASHWTWRDNEHMVFSASMPRPCGRWVRKKNRNLGFAVFKDNGSGHPTETLWQAPDGHQTYIPFTNNEWLVADSYPQAPDGEQVLYLFHVPTRRFVLLGRFASPEEYQGEWRCDMHPRVSRDGKQLIIDSPHGGNGRQQYIVDIRHIVTSQLPMIEAKATAR